MPQNTQNKISQTALKHYNQFRIVGTEALTWLKITTNIGKKLKFKLTSKKVTSNHWNLLPLK